MIQLIKSVTGRIRRMAMPKSSDVGQNYNLGDEKTFPDGSVRKLGYSNSGVRRWLSEKEQKEAGIKGPSNQGMPDTSQSILTEKIPEEIIVEEWKQYNEYLDIDNPFLNCLTYGDLEAQYFSQAYEFDSRKQIEGLDSEQLESIDKKLELLDKQFLAVQMYKISCLIYQILEFEPEFDYKDFIKDKIWQDLLDHLNELKQPSEVDYTELYGEENTEQQGQPAEELRG